LFISSFSATTLVALTLKVLFHLTGVTTPLVHYSSETVTLQYQQPIQNPEG